MGEFIYTEAKAQSQTFTHTKLIRSDVTFLEKDQHASLHLKQSKTDIHYKSIEIILVAKPNAPRTYPVKVLHFLFTHNLQPSSAFFLAHR